MQSKIIQDSQAEIPSAELPLPQNQSQTQHKHDSDLSEDSDGLIESDSGDEQENVEAPTQVIIGEEKCLEDDEISDDSDEDVQQEQSVIGDSDEQQESRMRMEQAINPGSTKARKHKLSLFDYQNILFNRSLGKNRIIYLPTGKGKTLVSIASMYYYLCKNGAENKKIVFLANTIQLVKQQADSIKRNLEKIIQDEDLSSNLSKQEVKLNWKIQDIKNKVCCLHGEKTDEVGMTRRKKIQSQLSNKKLLLEALEKSTIVVMISQMFLNCLRRGYTHLSDFSFIVFDQCHHCHGNHPYAGIMREFYFNTPKLSPQVQKKMQQRQTEISKPVIMGLTASPVTQETFDKTKLVKEIGELCGNLDSRFTSYEVEKIKSDTTIEIIEAKEPEHREQVPDLIAHFQKFRDHKESYEKIRKHFPEYFQCVKKIIDFLKSKYEKQLNLLESASQIQDVELLLFYDIKECLLIKLRDVWLDLGEYAFSIAFQELYGELGSINLKSEQNKMILNEIMEIIKQYIVLFNKKFGECKQQFFSAKVNELIKLFSPPALEKPKYYDQQSPQQTTFKGKYDEMVVVFAAKRRTVKYLERLIKNYRETLPEQQQRSFDCDKVTGYSIRTTSDYSKNDLIFDVDPSSTKFFQEAEHRQIRYNEGVSEERKISYMKQNNESESRALENEYRRMRSVKYGKLLLEVEEKYSTQIQTIKRFRLSKFRILITTSVTEEGFDIPDCKMVISFDRPTSLKSYIQIKGRARQNNSKYFIFTTSRNHTLMCSNRNLYDDIINATFEIAINKFSDEITDNKEVPAIVREEGGYQQITVRDSGAIINTSYSLQILKMYCASLRQPNKPRFYYIETPNVAFRCLVYFPDSAPLVKPYIVGNSKPSKQQALKSAAFQAVKYLYTEKYIKSDLRPKKYEELEDERQIEKFDDIDETHRNEAYKRIFEEEVRIKCEKVSERKFIRFYFKSISSKQLDFPQINPTFDQQKQAFENNEKKFPFQVYLMNFNNAKNMKQLRKDDNEHEIGVLTCFQEKYNSELFSGYEYNFEEKSAEKFTLKLEEEHLMLTKQEYNRLKNAHSFIVTTCMTRQVYHYSQKTGEPPKNSKWNGELDKSNQIQEDTEREYFPLLVVLKKKGNKYTIDEQLLENIQKHENIFEEVYKFHNRTGKQTSYQKFPQDLNPKMEELLAEIKANKYDGSLLVQSIQKQTCFHKCIISGKEVYNDGMEKNRDKKKSLLTKNKKLCSMFTHAQEEIKEVLKIVYWSKFRKEREKQFFQRDGKLTMKDVENSKYYLLSEYIVFPMTAGLIFKATLAVQYLFKAIHEYCLAFSFRNIKLPEIIKDKLRFTNIHTDPFTFHSYPNLVIENGASLFKYLAENTNSNYLRAIGRSYKQGTNFEQPKYESSFSKINMSVLDQSSINQKGQIQNQSLNESQYGFSRILDESIRNYSVNESVIVNETIPNDFDEKSKQLVSQIKITEILKVLTSRMYKFNKQDNYEEYEFIGDVVLKMLSTIQIFLEKSSAEQSELHLARANIICNANLHRKSILKNFYRYVLTKKSDEMPPPFRFPILENTPLQNYERTSIKKYNENTEIEGFNYIPGKVHADIVEALIGAFYLHLKNLEDCQTFLYFMDVLKKPYLKVNFDESKIPEETRQIPKIYTDFEQRIGYSFRNKGLLIQSLTHSSFKSILHTVVDKNNIKQLFQKIDQNATSQISFMAEDGKKINKSSNTKTISSETFYERLEFLGDSILDLIVVEYLHEKYGTKDQGTLTALKQAGVSNKTLGMIAVSKGMHELILMDYPENDRVMRQFKTIHENFNTFLNNPQALIAAEVNSIKILGDVFESLVGAIFVDLHFNYSQTREVVMRIMKEFLDHYTDMETVKKGGRAQFQQFLDRNNYRGCVMKKDTTQEIKNGNFNFKLIDRTGNVVDDCWETTQKRAWDAIVEKHFYNNPKQNK